jgi:tetraacyldisaccharide 4'-kinase
MKTPAFWNHKTLLARLLLPLSWLYWLGARIQRACTTPAVFPIPIICIGNITAGGSGKTPVALAIGERLKQKNMRAFFLSRGYGGSLTGPVLVNPAMHSAREVGDEPLLLARVLPTIVAKDRKRGAAFAVAAGAQAIIMDDGFQNPSIKKTLSLIVIDSGIGMGNGWMLPAGPLREPASAALNRAHGVIILSRVAIPADNPPANIFFATVMPSSAVALTGARVVAFCGIAYPQKFFESLSLMGADIVARHAYADHHAYSINEIAALAQEAASKGAILITTAKDAARLGPKLRSNVQVLDITLAFQDEDKLDALLAKALPL